MGLNVEEYSKDNLAQDDGQPDKKKWKSFWTINRDMLPFKLHFFLFCGALSGVFPYKTVLAKSVLGLRAKDLAVVYTSHQFLAVVTKMLMGLLVDYLNKLKLAIIAVSVMQSVFYVSLLFVPRIDNSKTIVTSSDENKCMKEWIDSESNSISWTSNTNQCCPKEESETRQNCAIDLRCYSGVFSDELLVPISCNESKCAVACFTSTALELKEDNRSESRRQMIGRERVWTKVVQLFPEQNLSYDSFRELDIKFNNPLVPENYPTSMCIALILWSDNKDYCAMFRSSDVKDRHDHTSDDHSTPQVTGNSLYSTYQFWLFTLIFLCAGLSSDALFTISDTACHESLQKTGSDYGRQRAWGAISWGILAPLSGFLNDLVTKNSGHPNYSSGFYINIIFTVLLIMNISRLDLAKPEMPKTFWRDVKKVFRSREFIAFETAVFVVGMFTGVLWCYLMIYLESIGGSKLLLGLVHTCQCYLGEVPLMFSSGWITKKIGHFNVVSLTFLAFAIRFTCYYFLTNPWYVLPVEALHGLTYGVFYTNMTSYAKLSSLPGAETTSQAILCVTFEGLGAGIGCIIAGVFYDSYGGQVTFLFAALCSVLALVSHGISTYSLKSRSKTMTLEPTV